MKRDFVRDLLKNHAINDDVIKVIVEAIMDEHGKSVTEANDRIKTLEGEKKALTTERDELKTQIATRDTDITALQDKVKDNDSLSQQLSELQAKYKTDTDTLTSKIAAQERSYATEKFFDGYKFTSELARKAAIAEFEQQALEFKEGKFVGADDYMKTLQEQNPTAFVVEDKQEDAAPTFVKPKGGEPANTNPFEFNFVGVRPHATEK